MADIQEIPLDNAEEVQEIVEEAKAEEEPVSEIILDPAEGLPRGGAEEVSKIKLVIKPKAKGRPKGALNKGPSKPRAKKTQIQETPVEAPAKETYEPSSPKRNLRIPTDPTTSEVAAAMLKLLQDQSYSRQSRKQRLYSSWFQ